MSSREAPAKRWVFTVNNYSNDDFKKVCCFLESCQYGIVGKEVGASGTPHLQGFLILKDKKRLASLKKLIGVDIHLDRSNAKDINKPINYCKKGEQSKEEWNASGIQGPNFGRNASFNEYGSSKTNQGKRNDLLVAKMMLDAGKTVEDVARNDETFSVFLKYPQALREYERMNAPSLKIEEHVLRDWQASLEKELLKPASDTKIKFIVDLTGNSGKTWFAKYWMVKHPHTQILSPAKKQDMIYCIDEHIKYLFVNCTREQCEILNYSFLESVKDRLIFSTKYQSYMKHLRNDVHVVVMMNQHPDLKKLSAHRYDITVLPDPRFNEHVAAAIEHSKRTCAELSRKYEFPPPGLKLQKKRKTTLPLLHHQKKEKEH